MMKINDKEYGFYYSVGARCKFDAWLIKNSDQPYSQAVLELALIMNDAYNKKNGVKDALTKEIIYALPAREYDALAAEIEKQRNIDSEVTVEAEEEKPKKASRAGK